MIPATSEAAVPRKGLTGSNPVASAVFQAAPPSVSSTRRGLGLRGQLSTVPKGMLLVDPSTFEMQCVQGNYADKSAP